MGLDLIGFMMRGPITIDAETVRDAVTKTDELAKQLRPLLDVPDTSNLSDDTRKQLDTILTEWGISEDELDFIGSVEIAETFCSPTAIQNILMQFADHWNEVEWSRDMCHRIWSDHRVVFAGGDSYGDSPGGAMYELCEEMTRYGLWHLLGIE